MAGGDVATKIRPILRWAGGKRRLLPMINEVLTLVGVPNGATYVEPFLGGASVFLSVAHRFRKAKLSDANKALVVFYQQAASKPNELLHGIQVAIGRHNAETPAARRVRYTKVRERFNGRTAGRIASTPLDVARDFAYLNLAGFNGIFRTSKTGSYNVPSGRHEDRIEINAAGFRLAAAELAKAEITAQDFGTAIELLPRDVRHVIYLDPPYTVKHDNNGFIEYNQTLFEWKDQERLAEMAWKRTVLGDKVIVSNAAHSDVLALYDAKLFASRVVERSSTIATDPDSRVVAREVLIHSR